MGNESILREGLKPLVDKYAALGAEEIIFAHDDCYALMADAAPQYSVELPFKPVHIFEYLVRYLKSHPDKVKPLHWKVAYQRPCASRLTPGKEALLDEIFHLIGIERVARRYDRENALCCGQALKGFMQRGESIRLIRRSTFRMPGITLPGSWVFSAPCALTRWASPAGCRSGDLHDQRSVPSVLGESLPEEAYKNQG